MPLSVEETRRIAVEVLAADHATLQVVGVKTEAGSAAPPRSTRVYLIPMQFA